MVQTLAQLWGKKPAAKKADSAPKAAALKADSQKFDEEPIAAEKVLQVCDLLRSVDTF